MTATVAPAEQRPSLPESFVVYRDDGPVAQAIGRALGRRVPVPAMVLLLLGVVGILALAAVSGADASLGLTAAGVAWLLLTHGITTARRPRESFTWAVPSLVRIGEYGTLAWLAAADDAVPAGFALIAALTYRHYDLVYRLRHRAELPPRWLNRLAAGWDGRVIIAWVLLALGALPAAMYVWAAVLGVVSVAETVVSWRRFERERRTAGEFDELEGEGE
jgi:Family of unknown function (DUF5941)